jgi:hypothetical protein
VTELTGIVVKWRDYSKSVAELRKKAMQLMEHPHVTQEQLWQAHESLVRVMRDYYDVLPKAREKWPRFSSFPDYVKESRNT